METTKMGFGTKAIHAGHKKDSVYGALSTPIYQTSTFEFASCAQGGRRFAGEENGYIYSRLANPTTSMLEEKIAILENAEACVATSSGMGAISTIFWTICSAGTHIVADTVLYGCTYALLSEGLKKFGIEVTFVDTSDINQVKNALRENTVAVYLETPANPTLKISDIKEVAKVAHEYNSDITVICDNTFATPYLTRPLELGADVVVHSATKYLNGHGDVLAGFICGTKELMARARFEGLKDMTGSVIGAFESYLIIRGMKTFELRMERHCASALAIAKYLEKHEKVSKVHYPGLESHTNHEIAKKQMSLYGGVLAFEVKGGREAGAKLLDNLKLCTLAVSLGDPETLVEHPASMTHSPYSIEELLEAGIPEGLVRMAVGLENVEDIIADLEEGLKLI